MKKMFMVLGGLIALSSLVACGSDDSPGGSGGSSADASAGSGNTDGDATLSIILEAEDTITDGIEAGATGEAIQDGWSMTYTKFLTVVGDIEVELAADPDVHAHAHDSFVVDLTQAPEGGGFPLWKLENLEGGKYNFNFATLGAGDGATRHPTVSEADFATMKAADATYLIEGNLTKAEGESCPPPGLAEPGTKTPSSTRGTGADAVDCYANPNVAISLVVPAETMFGPCESPDHTAGFSIPDGGTKTVAITIHGDHIFFNGFPEGDEGGVKRQAQWLADCDLNLDGEVTQEELAKIAPSKLAAFASFELGGSPITPLDTMWTYVRAQLKTQGHLDGEGECPVDGTAHEHHH